MKQPAIVLLLTLLINVTNGFTVLNSCGVSQYQSALPITIRRRRRRRDYRTSTTSTTDTNNNIVLFAAGNGNDQSSNSSSARARGIYARPSAAIERGSGFYVPGLEGYRVRLLSGVLVLLLTYVNGFLSAAGIVSSTTSTVGFSSNLAYIFGSFLFFQASLEFFKKQQQQNSSSSSKNASTVSTVSNNNQHLQQRISSTIATTDDVKKEDIQWAAASFVSLTPASHFLVVRAPPQNNDYTLQILPEILYSLGDFTTDTTDKSSENNENDVAVVAAVQAVRSSKGGRIAVPETHPAASLLPPSSRRCIILQQIDQDNCILVGSSQLLPAFTANDLKWLGFLSKALFGI